MGGTTSRFGETDWDAVNSSSSSGGLTKPEETLDGVTAPTQHHTILTLKKSSSLVNQRAFQVCDLDDDSQTILFSSQPIEGTSKWFDLLDSNGKKIFCIQTTDSKHDHWQVYRYGRPNWEGQECEEDASSTFSKILPDDIKLYRTARMDITWNKNHGNVYKYIANAEEDPKGVLNTTQSILQVEEIKSITAQYQSLVPLTNSSPVNALLQHVPLVGYWVWEHTPHKHQIKMHLAKGTDIALHCIVAILTNMVRVEKQTDDEERMR